MICSEGGGRGASVGRVGDRTGEGLIAKGGMKPLAADGGTGPVSTGRVSSSSSSLSPNSDPSSSGMGGRAGPELDLDVAEGGRRMNSPGRGPSLTV